jgi:NAD(P)-dependent dehydrogenase (short-subunit alcohol dehydrogenase family)
LRYNQRRLDAANHHGLASDITKSSGHNMQLQDKTIVVTGGGHGIGKGLCQRFAGEQPSAIVVVDIDIDAAKEVADSIGGQAVACDVADENAVVSLIDETESNIGPIDLFCMNAGIAGGAGDDVSNEVWDQMIDINFKSHIYTARALVPRMLKRGDGYLLHTASAAGLLTEIASAPYAVTKHAVVAFAEWLRIAHGTKGLKVSCLCPQGVQTRMIEVDHPTAMMLRQGSIPVEQLAECVVEGISKETFLILPHPEVAKYIQNKANNYDGWIEALQGIRQKVLG